MNNRKPRRLVLLVAVGIAAGFGAVSAASATAVPNLERVMCQGRPGTIVGTDGDDVLTGTSGPDVIVGGRGNDVIRGDDGNDVICGGPGRDVLFGNAGDDLIDGADDDDLIGGNRGDDVLRGGPGDDSIYGSSGADQLQGGEDDDRLFGGGGNDQADGGNGNDLVAGNLGDDLLFGRAGADELRGRDGDDTLDGGPGDDTLDGGPGDDICRQSAGADTTVNCGADPEPIVTRSLGSFYDVFGVALHDDGRPAVVVHAEGNELRLLTCDDPSCVSFTNQLITDRFYATDASAIVIGPSGNPIIGGRRELFLCDDPLCESATSVGLPLFGEAQQYSLAMTSDGRPVVAVIDELITVVQELWLRIIVCRDASCSSFTTTSLPADAAEQVSLAVIDGARPVVSFRDLVDDNLSVGVCADAECTSIDARPLDEVGSVGHWSSVAVAATGHPLVSYVERHAADLKLAACGDAECSTADIVVLDAAGGVASNTSLALTVDGRPIVAYTDQAAAAGAVVRLAVCGDPTCATVTTEVVAAGVDIGRFSDRDLAIAPDGRAVTIYDADDSAGAVELVVSFVTVAGPPTG